MTVYYNGSLTSRNGGVGAAMVEFGDMTGFLVGNTGEIFLDEVVGGMLPNWLANGALITWAGGTFPGHIVTVNLQITQDLGHAKYRVVVQ